MMDELVYRAHIRAARAIPAVLQAMHLPGLLLEAERRGSGADANLIQRLIDSRIQEIEVEP